MKSQKLFLSLLESSATLPVHAGQNTPPQPLILCFACKGYKHARDEGGNPGGFPASRNEAFGPRLSLVPFFSPKSKHLPQETSSASSISLWEPAKPSSS